MKLKASEQIIWMIESDAIYPLGVKAYFSVPSESAHSSWD